MSILRDFEKRLERGVEGFFARTFKSGLQPVELAKALQRYARQYQQVGHDKIVVPNVYRFGVSPEDFERLAGHTTALTAELADVVRRTAADNGWRLRGPVQVELQPDETVEVGTYALRGKVEGSDDQSPAAPAASEAHREAGQDAPATARGYLVLEDGSRLPVDGRMVIGRLPDCDLTLDDASVSRRHARITRNGDQWVIEDLGSTNGVRVNGQARGQTELHDGDNLLLGTVHLSFALDY